MVMYWSVVQRRNVRRRRWRASPWRYVREEFKKFGEQQALFPSPRGVHEGIMRARVGHGTHGHV